MARTRPGRPNERPGRPGIWIAPGILEALIPGRTRSHGSTAATVALRRGQKVEFDITQGQQGPRLRASGSSADAPAGITSLGAARFPRPARVTAPPRTGWGNRAADGDLRTVRSGHQPARTRIGLCVGEAAPSATTPGYSPANLAIITEAVMIRRARAEASQPGNEVPPLISQAIRWAGGMETANVAQNARRTAQAPRRPLMITIDTASLHDVALVIGTAFPVLAVAYYSAARGMLDDKLQAEGPEWNVDMPIPEWTRNKLGRFLIQMFGNTRFREGRANKFPFNERFKLSTDRGFVLALPLGFILTLAYLLFSWRWALALSIVLLQVTIDILILFGTQVSMIRLASAIADPRHERSDSEPAKSFWGSPDKPASPLDTRPMAALIRAFVISSLLLCIAVYAAIIVGWASTG